MIEYHVQAFREPQTDEEREFANPFIPVELVLKVDGGYLAGFHYHPTGVVLGMAPHITEVKK